LALSAHKGNHLTQSTFADLGLSETILRALATQNYTTPTPIQAQAIPVVLNGGDVLGIAQTGTGKTAAFSLPMLQRLSAHPHKAPPRAMRCLILAPTRELVVQIGEAVRAYGANLGLRSTTIVGGVGIRPQIAALSRGIDVVVATPGRLLDLVAQKQCRLDHVEIFVIDEADRMFDMGFIRDVRKIVADLPTRRQSLLFSATMPSEVAELANKMLRSPTRIEVAPWRQSDTRIDQQVYHVEQPNKGALLTLLLQNSEMSRVIVFTRTKHGANRVSQKLEQAGISADAIHGNKSQGARQRALDNFRKGEVRVLVATDIAARGIDVDDISHVINFELPDVSESYVHRIGRTARGGATGKAISFCASDEVAQLKSIEKLTQNILPVIESHPFHAALVPQSGRSARGNSSAGRQSDMHRSSQRRSRTRRAA
jgi:ATP-dependent RNA helicase RhlE